LKTIFITEKPSVAQEYRKVLKVQSEGRTDGYVEGYSPVLSKDVIITWAVGHLIGICSPEEQNPQWSGNWSADKLPMIPQKFKYEPQKATYSQFKVVKSLYTRNDIEAIYYAGDSGREGIYIQALIRNQIFRTAPRFEERVVWIDSYTEESILNGIKTAKPYNTYQPMIDSGYARAMSDWLIGMNFTEGFTLTSGKLINTGRVMTPTLAMIVNRQKEIDNFTKTYYYGVTAGNNIFWKASEKSRFFESDLLYNENGFSKLDDANSLCNEMNGDKKLTVEDVKVQTKTEYAPYLFNLADLQAYCSRVYKISPAQALSIAQSLYEKKFTTYPRTDCRFLSSAVATDLKSKGYNVPARYIDDSKVTDHYAIIPTFYGNADSLSGLEQSVYNAVLGRFLDTMKPPYVYDAVSVIYQHSDKEHFYESFRKIKQMGFKESKGDDEEDTEVADKAIPQKGQTVQIGRFEVRNLETKPPVSYTTGSLILAMEKAGKLIEDEELREQIKTCGIGTSATRASIIEKLKEKEFISVDKKQKIMPTDFGKAVIPIIEKYDEALISPVKTADMEAKLNAIATEELSLSDYMESVNKYVSDTTKKILSSNTESLSAFNKSASSASSGKVFDCPCCGKPLKFGRFGWYCDSKDFSFGAEIFGHKMKESDLEDLLTKGKTKAYTFKWSSGKSSKAKIVLDKSKKNGTGFEFDNSAPKASSASSSKSKTSSKSSSGWGSTSSTKKSSSKSSSASKKSGWDNWGKK
jgi:DNA topoisomerase-3